MQEDFIICHYGKREYLYSLSKNKFYKNREGIAISNEPSAVIQDKLQSICAAYDWRVPDRYSEILEKTYIAHSMRRHYRMDLYQTPILPETSVRRAMQVGEKKQKVALIGDDDLVSIPLALMGHDVLVLDVDEYLIDLINQANKFFSINITAKNVNLLNEIGPELKGKYDVIYADPVSTNEGYSVFVKRGYELLKDNGFAFITVTQRFQPVLDEFAKKASLKEICRYNSFCNSYNHRIDLIDDIANMVKYQKTGNEFFLDFNADMNFFTSQKEAKVMWTIELFNIDRNGIREQIQSILFEVRDNMDKCLQINKYVSNNNNYYFIFEDNDEFNIVLTDYSDDHIEITVTANDEVYISRIKNIIFNTISFETKREEVFVCGLPVIQGRADMEINTL